MAYTIQAVIGKAGSFLTPLPNHLRAIPLGGGLEMLPLGEEALEFYGVPFCPLTDDGAAKIPLSLLNLCEDLSESRTLAYIEAELSGGTGTQAYMIFSNGKQFGEPVVSVEAINQALRFLGISKGVAFDEFEAVGLGQHRNTDQWLR